MLIIFLIVVFLILVFAGNYFFNFSLNRDKDKSNILDSNDDIFIDEEQYEIDREWFDKNSIKVESTSITNVKLFGYEFLNKNSESWIIVVHGYAQDAKEMSTYIKNFYNLGYNVFAPDLLAHGNSEGKTISMGGFDSKDLKNWVVKLSESYNSPNIALFGISMGAATVINSLKEDLPKNVKAFIEDSGYIDLEEQFSYQFKKLFNLPKFPLINVAEIVTKIRGGYSFKDVNATEGLKKTKIPGLILHGDKDGFVPLENSKRIYELLSSEKEIEIFENCAHVSASGQCRERYWKVIKEFLDKYIL